MSDLHLNPVPRRPVQRRNVFIIYNPTAGWRRRRRLRAVIQELAKLGSVTTLEATARRGDAEAFARQIAPGLYDAVIVAGGDGTANEVVNGLRQGGPPLGMIPMGTANVLAAEIGLEPESFARTIILGRAQPIHTGRINDRRFVMMAGIGFDARVVSRVSPTLKRAFGRTAYIVESLREIARLKPMRFTLTLDGVPYQAASAVIANGRYYGGKMVCARDARLTEPVFQVCLFLRDGRWNALRYATALCLGVLHRLSDVKIVPARRVVIDGPAGEPVQADGDIVARLPVTIELEESTLSLIVPA